jgi:hypothetical protein
MNHVAIAPAFEKTASFLILLGISGGAKHASSQTRLNPKHLSQSRLWVAVLTSNY